jgi:hypothetical protein
MNPLQILRGMDSGLAAGSLQRSDSLDKARAEAALAYQQAQLEKLQGRTPESMADQIGQLYYQAQRSKPAEGGQDAAMQALLNEAAKRVAVAEGQKLDSRQIAAQLQAPEMDQLQRYIVERGGGGLKSGAIGAIADLNRAMGRQDWVGGAARTGAVYAPAAGGATAGALGLIELINYLQGNGQEPVA